MRPKCTSMKENGFTLLELVVTLALGGIVFMAFGKPVVSLMEGHANNAQTVDHRADANFALKSMAAELGMRPAIKVDCDAGEMSLKRPGNGDIAYEVANGSSLLEVAVVISAKPECLSTTSIRLSAKG